MAVAEPGPEETRVRDIATSRVDQIGGTIAALSDIVRTFGHIERRHMEIVADVFNLTVAEIRGVVSFYSDLRTEPVGRRHIRICQAEACQAVGGRELTAGTVAKLGIDLGETAADGSVSLEAVYCLGLCTSGPSATVDGRAVPFATVEVLTGSLQPGSARGNPSQEKSLQPGSARGNPSHENSPQPGSARVSLAEDGSARGIPSHEK